MALPSLGAGTNRLKMIVTGVASNLDSGGSVVSQTLTMAVDPSDPDGYNATWFAGSPTCGFMIIVTQAALFNTYPVGTELAFDVTAF